MFFHSPKPSSQEMALSSSNSKDTIKDHHTNLTLHPLVENPSSFAGSSIRSEKDSSIVSQEIKAKPGARQKNNSTNNFTEQKDTSNKTDPSTAQAKFRKTNSSNSNNNNNKVIRHNRKTIK